MSTIARGLPHSGRDDGTIADTTMAPRRTTTITPETKVSLTVAMCVSVTLSLLWAAFRAGQYIAESESRIREAQVVAEYKSVENALRRVLENPGTREPDPRDPSRVLSIPRTP